MQTDLLKLIHDTKAVSIWNRKTGPVFWYIAGVPGPFYVNTEYVIGRELADPLLQSITNIVTCVKEPSLRASQVQDVILEAYQHNTQYQRVIEAMITHAKSAFPDDSYHLISGGERRDWLFSIPFAFASHKNHVTLFKNHDFYSPRALEKNEKTLHVADLINNAASYFDMWLPILEKAQLTPLGTICINSRGDQGLKRLQAAGVKTLVLNSINLDFFKEWLANQFIDQETFDELSVYFTSPPTWASRYLIGRTELFDLHAEDKKSIERLKSFFTHDPWGLSADHTAFFNAMREKIQNVR